MNCFPFFHKWTVTYDSVTERFKFYQSDPELRKHFRVPYCGYTRYKCDKCGKEKTETWSIF